MISRRKLIGRIGLFLAAPAIVKASSLMPVKAWAGEYTFYPYVAGTGRTFLWVGPDGALYKMDQQVKPSDLIPGKTYKLRWYPIETATVWQRQ